MQRSRNVDLPSLLVVARRNGAATWVGRCSPSRADAAIEGLVLDAFNRGKVSHSTKPLGFF